MKTCTLTTAAAFLTTAILCLFQGNPAVAMPPKNKTPSTIIGIVSGYPNSNSNNNSNDNNVSFFKRVVQKSVALVLFPLFVTLEIIWNSIGLHSDIGSLGHDHAADTRIHVTCATILKLWTDLRTMEHAQKVYLEAMDNMVNAEVLLLNETYADIVDKIDKAYAEDPTFGKLYARLRAETALTLAISSDHRNVESTLSQQDRDNLLFTTAELGARMLLFKFHSELQQSTASGSGKVGRTGRWGSSSGSCSGNGDNSDLARAILAVAKDEGHSKKMQKIFDEVLRDEAPFFGLNGSDDRAAKLMFRNLRKKIADDADLKKVFEKHKIHSQ